MSNSPVEVSLEQLVKLSNKSGCRKEPFLDGLKLRSLVGSDLRETFGHCWFFFFLFSNLICFSSGSVRFSSVAQSCPTLCDPMNHSTPGHPVYHQLPEFTQTHVHRVSDAIQPSHPLFKGHGTLKCDSPSYPPY